MLTRSQINKRADAKAAKGRCTCGGLRTDGHDHDLGCAIEQRWEEAREQIAAAAWRLIDDPEDYDALATVLGCTHSDAVALFAAKRERGLSALDAVAALIAEDADALAALIEEDDG